MDKWRYVGTRSPLQSPQGTPITMHVISVPHPNGDWEAIYCHTKKQAEDIIITRTELAQVKAQLVEKEARLREAEGLLKGWLDESTFDEYEVPSQPTYNPVELRLNTIAFLAPPQGSAGEIKP